MSSARVVHVVHELVVDHQPDSTKKEPGRRAINVLDCNRSHVTQSNKPHDLTTRRYYVEGRFFSRFDIRRFFALTL